MTRRHRCTQRLRHEEEMKGRIRERDAPEPRIFMHSSCLVRRLALTATAEVTIKMAPKMPRRECAFMVDGDATATAASAARHCWKVPNGKLFYFFDVPLPPNGKWTSLPSCSLPVCLPLVFIPYPESKSTRASTSKMRFRFCGDLDVPDWILKEITLLSKIVRLSSEKDTLSDKICSTP